MKVKKIVWIVCLSILVTFSMAACRNETLSDPVSKLPSTTSSVSAYESEDGVSSNREETTNSSGETTEFISGGETTGTTATASFGTTSSTKPFSGTTAAQQKLEVSLAQWHPGIPGYDAAYQLSVKYGGLYVNADDIQISSETSGVRIQDGSVIVPESVRNKEVPVKIVARYKPTGQTASLNIPVKKWNKAFGDEFEGTTVDLSKWSFSTGETSTCAAVPDSFVMQDGRIRLQLNKRSVTRNGKTYEYVSTSLNTSETFKTVYGCFMVNFKATSFGGLNMGCSVYPVGAYSKNYLFFKKSDPKLGCAEIDPIEMSANWDNHYYISEHFYDYTSKYEHSSLTSYVDVEFRSPINI